MRRNDDKFTIGKYHINTMDIIKLFPVKIFMAVTKFPCLTILLFCKRGPFRIFGQIGDFSKKQMAEIGYFAVRKNGREKTRMVKAAKSWNMGKKKRDQQERERELE